MWRHVRPASLDRYMPSPWLIEPPVGMSPVPAYTTLGSDGATAIAPTAATLLIESNTGNQVAPALVVFVLVLVTARTLWEVNVPPPTPHQPER